MHELTTVDWSWIIGFLVIALGLSIYHSRKSSQSIEDYFVAGQKTPWWILGTSIVATTFAADTPLVVTGLVITSGISGNWYWWAVVPSGMLGVFFFAKLWRRSGCLTQAEFVAIRYGPRRAPALRTFYVFYHGVLRNAFTLGFVNLAMAKIVTLCTPLGQWEALAICFVLTTAYTALGGINGVMWTDFVQFFLALGTAIGIAYYAIQDCTPPLTENISPLAGGEGLQSFFSYFPQIENSSAFWSFLIFITIYWVACTPTDCNGYAVQRLLSAKNEKHAVWGYLWFNFAHYVLRSWPWILVGLVVLAGSDHLDPDPEKAYVIELLRSPGWLIGPALAALLAAYMSTVDTHLNWGASYLVNDFYKPYLRPRQSKKHYVYAGHIMTLFLALAGVGTTTLMSSIVQGWGLVFGLLSGMGIVGILRWLWWRVTAWTELGCMLAAGLATITMHFAAPQVTFPFTLLVIVPFALLGAGVGTFAFDPEPRDILIRFYNQVRPPGGGWRIPAGLQATTPLRGFPVGDEDLEPDDTDISEQQLPIKTGLLRPTLCWILGTGAIYCALFGVGDLLLKSKVRGITLVLLALVLSVVVGLIHRPDAIEDDPTGKHAV